MRLISTVITLWACIVGMAEANPIVTYHESYIDSENLVITLGENEASFSGEFVFRSSPSAKGHHPDEKANLEVPIWIPSSASTQQTNLAEFLNIFSTERMNWIEEDWWGGRQNSYRPIVDKTIGLGITVDGEELPYKTFAIYTYQSHMESEYVTNKYMRPDIYEVYFREDFDQTSLTNGAKISLSYKQPLIMKGDRSFLFYVPIFRNIKPNHLEENSKQYRIVVRCPEGFKLIPRSKLEFYSTPTSSELIISPQHETPILVELKRRAKSGKGEFLTPPPQTTGHAGSHRIGRLRRQSTPATGNKQKNHGCGIRHSIQSP